MRHTSGTWIAQNAELCSASKPQPSQPASLRSSPMAGQLVGTSAGLRISIASGASMFNNDSAKRLWSEMNKAIDSSDKIVPCTNSDPDAWFPEPGFSSRNVVALCKACPVNALCLDFALANDEPYGIWGGLSRHQRLALQLKQRRELRTDFEKRQII
jgi:hypothetical protein